MSRRDKFVNWMQHQNDLVQSVLFTVPVAAAVGLITALLWATEYPISRNIKGEITDLEGETICPESKDECFTVVDAVHVDTGDQIFIVSLRERFQATAERDRLETGDIIDVTYRSTRDKEFFGANDDTREVYERSLMVLSPQ